MNDILQLCKVIFFTTLMDSIYYFASVSYVFYKNVSQLLLI